MITRSLDQAKKAYKRKSAKDTVAAHNAKSTQENHSAQGQYIKSAVYGGLDGIITTFAVVAGVAGAELAAGVVLILGFANLIADGLSMAIGDFLSTKSENEYHKAERERESWEIENYPEGEKKELVELYTDKGMTKKDAETIVSLISKNKSTWVDIMMVEELGIIESTESPLKNAVVTFISFAVFGLIPILAYVLAYPIAFFRENTFAVAIALTLLTLFTLGAVKVKVTGKNFFKSGLETVSVGGLAAFAAYLVGHLLRGLAGA